MVPRFILILEDMYMHRYDSDRWMDRQADIQRGNELEDILKSFSKSVRLTDF